MTEDIKHKHCYRKFIISNEIAGAAIEDHNDTNVVQSNDDQWENKWVTKCGSIETSSVARDKISTEAVSDRLSVSEDDT